MKWKRRWAIEWGLVLLVLISPAASVFSAQNSRPLPRVYFAALQIPFDLHCRFDSYRAELQEKLKEQGGDYNWSSLSKLHLTLYYFGSLQPLERTALISCLRSLASRREPFLLNYRGLGTFPFRGAELPRVLWADCQGDEKQLQELASGVTDCAQKLSLRSSDYPFVPHVTLLRAPSRSLGRRLAMELDEKEAPSFGHHEVSSFVLYRSSAPEDKGGYTVIERFPLGREESERD